MAKQNKDNTWKIISGVAIGLLIIVLLFFAFNNQNNNSSNENTNTNLENLDNTPTYDCSTTNACVSLALENGDENYCEGLGDLGAVESCKADVAGEWGSIKICDSLKMGQTKQRCYSDVAAKLGDKSLCNDLSGDFKVGCIVRTATAESDCNILTDDYDRTSCYANLVDKTGDVNICFDLEQQGTLNDGTSFDTHLNCCFMIDNAVSSAVCKERL